MGLTRTLAVRGLVPSRFIVGEIRNNLYRLMTEVATTLERHQGDDGLALVAEMFRNLGREDAKSIKTRLGLGETIRDALDAWLVVGRLMGAKIQPRWIGPDRVETDHPYCPQHEIFVQSGRLFCESVCLPYVEALATGVAPEVEMEVVRPATMERACTKALVIRRGE